MISVILPAYVPNEQLLEVTRRCLQSLKATENAYQLVIIDNGSTRTASQLLKRDADIYLRYEEPLGYARAANIGLAVSDQNWLCVINTDIEWCSEDWIGAFLADWVEASDPGVLSAMDDGRQGIVYDESWFSCWFTHRSVIQEVGYFDESLPFRFHDQDYAIRVHQAGYRVMRTGNVPVSHINSATYNTMGRNEDPAERDEMLRRYGFELYNDWVRSQPVVA